MSAEPRDIQAAKLSERQRQCLRLVARGYETKEIARELQIGVETVKEHLRRARAAFNVVRSVEAARYLEESEGTLPPRWGTLAGGIETPPILLSDQPSQFQDGHGVQPLAPTERAFPPRRWELPLPIPTRGRPRNELSIYARLSVMVILLVLLILAVGFFVQSSRGLS